jgi:hypothetical protein
MYQLKCALAFIIVFFYSFSGFSQQIDSIQKVTTFSGSLGITNNGFSIVPSFSLNQPAIAVLLSWKKSKFSIDPDVRLTFDGRKGSILLWFRYHAIEGEKFRLRVGAHPALNFQLREITSNGVPSEITQMRRFVAWEFNPSYQITKKWGIGFYYLQGNGMQKDGPQTTHFVNLNTAISKINMGKNIRLTLLPAVYFLYLDGFTGNYFTATGILAHTKLPLTLQSSINKTFDSSLPNNKDFIWNVQVNYNFRKNLVAKMN